MKKLIFFFIVFLLAILIGLGMHLDPGYVLIAYYHWTLETSLWVALIAFLIFFATLYKGLSLHRSIRHFSKTWKLKRRLKYFHQPYLKMQKGLFSLISGDWKKAEKNFLAGTNGNQVAAINYIAAAFAASKLHDDEHQNIYIQKAKELAPDYSVEISLVQIKLLLDEEKPNEALEKLKRLHEMHPYTPSSLKLLKDVYRQLHQWNDLLTILPSLLKQKIISESEHNNLLSEIYSSLFLGYYDDLSRLKQFWNVVPRAAQKNARVVYYYAQALLSLRQDDEAWQTIAAFLNRQWDRELILLYGQIISRDTDKPFHLAKKWERDHAEDDALLLTLGRLACRLKRWADAEDYLISSLAIKENRDAFLALAYLYLMKGESEKAESMFKKIGV